MRLLTFEHDGRTRAGSLQGETVTTLAEFEDVGALLAAGGSVADWSRLAEAGDSHPLADVRVRRPVLEPGAVFCVGLNYRSHILEMGRELPTDPTLFSKLPRALTDPEAEILLPAASSRVDYEAELTAVVGKGGREIPAERAWEAIAGLTLLNDVSMRDFQRRTIQWFAGKTWEASTPVGPLIQTTDGIEPDEIEIVLSVNGSERQRGSMSDLVFGIPELVADISRVTTLRPGDLIATGTPGGVGAAMEPPTFLADGDLVEIDADGLGTLRNRFVAARA